MSTYQPPGGIPSEPTPYTQPQDPWGHEPGIAAAPTDPIPQQAPPPYGQYAQGVAAPSVWTQETMSHGGPGYDYVQQPSSSRVGVYILVILAVVILGGGGGVGAYLLIKNRAATQTPGGNGTTEPAAITTPATTTGPASVEPSTVKVGDCLFNQGSEATPIMQTVPCTKPKSFKVVKIQSGESIPEGPKGTFDKENTSAVVCAGTGSTAWYAWDSSDDKRDFFFCLTQNP